MPDSLIGRLLNNTYKIERLLADGGMSQVYLAEQVSLSRPVAIKVLLPGFDDQDFIDLFLREARVSSHLNHTNIVGVVDFGRTEDGLVFLAMEYLDGYTLDTLVEHNGALMLSNIVWLMEQVCSAIHAAHKGGVVHRDLKPGNIMVAKMAGDEQVAKVVDFGISKPMSEGDLKHTSLGMVIGTPGFLAPEQIQGRRDLDCRADIYALGALIHYLAVGQRPFAGANRELIMQKQLREAPLPLDADQLFDKDCVLLQPMITKAMALDREQRYNTVADLWQDLLQAVSHSPSNEAVQQVMGDVPRDDDGSLYHVVFAGELQPNADQAQTKENMQRIFKINALQVKTLFSGKRLVVRKNLSRSQARALEGKLEKAGLQVIVECMDDKTRLVPREPRSLPAAKLGVPIALTGIASRIYPSPSVTSNAPSGVQEPFTAPLKSNPSASFKWLSGWRKPIHLIAGLALLSVVAVSMVPHWRYHIMDVVRQTTPVPGVSADYIAMGLSAAFSGSAKELGRSIEFGIKAGFNEVNDAGGVHGRKLILHGLDDGYEPARAQANIEQLLTGEQPVFAFIGNVGTPTNSAILPTLLNRKSLLFAPVTGAAIFRRDPPDRYVFNYRASYQEETAALVSYFVEELSIDPKAIGVFYQDDAFGLDGLKGVEQGLAKYHVRPEQVITARYQRNTSQVKPAMRILRNYVDDIEALIIVATFSASANITRELRSHGYEGEFANVSFVGAEALAERFKEMGGDYAEGVLISQVVPAVDSYASAVIEYREALGKYYPEESPSYASLEGYIAARIFVEGLRQTGRELTVESLIAALESLRGFDMGIGGDISFHPSDHQGSHKIWGSKINDKGQVVPVDLSVD